MNKKASRGRKRSIGSLGVLALLEHESGDGWTADAIAAECKRSPHTIRHHLARLLKYNQVQISPMTKQVPFKKNPERSSTITCFRWTAAERGKDRLEYKGGHDVFCPRCRENR